MPSRHRIKQALRAFELTVVVVAVYLAAVRYCSIPSETTGQRPWFAAPAAIPLVMAVLAALLGAGYRVLRSPAGWPAAVTVSLIYLPYLLTGPARYGWLVFAAAAGMLGALSAVVAPTAPTGRDPRPAGGCLRHPRSRCACLPVSQQTSPSSASRHPAGEPKQPRTNQTGDRP